MTCYFFKIVDQSNLEQIKVNGGSVLVYNNIGDFETDVNSAGYDTNILSNENIKKAFDVYTHAKRTHLKMLIVGRVVDNSNMERPGIDSLVRENFGTMSEIETGGSVLNSENWTTLMNDSWIMGGIHSNVNFYLASKRTHENIVGNNPRYPITVTGRELIGLSFFGYKVFKHQKLGEVLIQSDPRKAQEATFIDYLRRLDEVTPDGKLTAEELALLISPATLMPFPKL